MKPKRRKIAGGAPRRAYGAVILPGVILFVALVFRIVSLTTFDPLFDEQITRDVVTGIWHGEWSNNWKHTVSAENYREDQYNFSSYLYADALIAGAAAQLDAFPSDGKPDLVFWSRLFSAVTGTLAVYLFYLVARRLFPPATAIVAMALMAAMPLLVQDSHYARPEAFVSALTGAAYFLLVQFDSHRDRLRYLGGTMPLFTDAQFNHAMQLAATLDEDALLRVPDYHDAFTKRHLDELERRTNWREVGYFPSVFEGFDVNTLIAYHSVSFRYLFVRAAPPAP